MSKNIHVIKNHFSQTPHIISLAELTTDKNVPCGKAMELAAKKAEQNKWPIVQFHHPNPPAYGGPENTTKVVTLIDSSVLPCEVPRSFIHVGTSEIKVNGYFKVVPNFKRILQQFEELVEE